MVFNDTEEQIYCAHCGGESTHQRVLLWFRGGEDQERQEVDIIRLGSGHKAIKDVTSHHNPSARRDGIMIGIQCESCEEWTALTVVQHKGATLKDVKKFPNELLNRTPRFDESDLYV